MSIDWIRGNHDFALGPFLEKDLGVSVHTQLQVDLGGKRYLLAHGDEADRTLGYRATRTVLRSQLFGAFMRALGPARARSLGETLAEASHDQYGPIDSLLEAQATWAKPYLAADVDVVVVGHSHTPGIQMLAGGKLITLGDFMVHHTWLAVDGEPELREFNPSRRD